MFFFDRRWAHDKSIKTTEALRSNENIKNVSE